MEEPTSIPPYIHTSIHPHLTNPSSSVSYRSFQQRPTKILVVDDEPDMAELVRGKFRKSIRKGELVFTFAADGAEALERLDEDPEIDLVLTDINMPRMDGLTLLGRLTEREPVPKAVVISAYGDMDNIRAAMNRGAFDFLIKPIELDDLQITVEKSCKTVAEEKQARFVRALFSRYLSAEVVQTLLKQPEAAGLGGQKRTVTMLMSDLRGFSLLTERLPPEQVVEVLNLYLGRMAEVITAYQGTINEFIGDAIFAIFGAPILREDDAVRAVACALAMQQAMGRLNGELAARGLAPLEMGIGVHTGEVVVGNIGSERRAKYGVVGSHVNLTSRIEGHTVGGQVLLSGATLEAAGPAVRVGEPLQVQAKGFSQPVTLYPAEALGPPYDLALPALPDEMTTLAEPLPITFTALDGKQLTGARRTGELRRLSARGAALHAAEPPARLDNLRIDLPARAEGGPPGALYAKVIDVRPDAGCTLRFTAVPEDVAETLRRLREG